MRSMAEHASLSPSSSERWTQCPASVRLVSTLPPGEGTASIYAAEGTTAHALGEMEVSLTFGRITPGQHDLRQLKWERDALRAGYDVIEMKLHIRGYVDLVLERAALYPMSQVLVEQQVETGIPSCWGTADVVIVSPQHVEIIDLKYGQGVPVDATGNPQLRLYGVGALDTYGDVLGETEVVRCTVYQPRLSSTSTEEMTAAELRAWRDGLLPVAALALSDDAPFGPSETACRWCPASGQCRAQMEWATERDFGRPPDLLSLDELGEALFTLPAVRSWASAVELTALDLAYSKQKPIPGWKVVLSGGKRVILDGAAAIKVLLSRGFTEEEVSKTSVRGIGELEILIKTLPKVGRRNAKLEDVLGELVTKTEGKPALVPEDDKRPAVSPATEAGKDFK